MTHFITSICADAKGSARRISAVALFVILVASYSFAQSLTDGSTPPGVAPGAPAGSYSLSGFESINFYNGNLNFTLPLLQVGGRGNVTVPVTLTIEQKWRVKEIAQEQNPSQGNGFDYYYYPDPVWWNQYKPTYGPGSLITRYGKDIYMQCISMGHPGSYWATLARLTFTAPDGTEYELHDKLTDGKPSTGHDACSINNVLNRGKVFVTGDGTSATFISDADIYDHAWADGVDVDYPSGYLLMRDGTRYRIDHGGITWVRDRNGNQITFSTATITNGSETTIKDSLNREVKVTENAPGADGLHEDQIAYKGFGGAQRTISISYALLENALRPGSNYHKTLESDLFPDLNGASSTNYYNPVKVSSVLLPDGRSYKFYYNPYGELARVDLPTGGKIEYDWAAGEANLSGLGPYDVVRRVVERRVYSDGTNLESKMVIGQPVTIDNYRGTVTVDSYDGAGTLKGCVQHYYYGIGSSAAGSFGGASYAKWKDSREYATEIYDSDGTTLLRRVEYNWQQAGQLSWWYGTPPAYSYLWDGNPDHEPANNPRIVETVTTLADTNQVTKTTSIDPTDSTKIGFDQFNNPTDTWEYDYGQGSPGSLLRHIHTDYVTVSEVNSVNYTDRTLASPYLLSLVKELQVYGVNSSTGAEQLAAKTHYYYDQTTLISRSNISGLDSAFTTSYTTRGNVTRVSRWLDTDDTWIDTNQEYDIAGNVTKVTDPLNHQTTFNYSDHFGVPDDNEARSNTAPTELNGKATYAFPTSVTNALGQTTYAQYDYYHGGLVNAEDLNGVVSSRYYNDSLDRITQTVSAANNTDRRSQTTISYDDANRTVTVTSDLNTFNDNLLKSQSLYDGLGRSKESRVYEGASYIETQRIYDSFGRVYQVSNPYRPAEGSPVWTETQYDVLGRVKTVITPDGAQLVFSYSGNIVTGRDQTGKQRRATINSLGQEEKLEELYGYPATNVYATTSYKYDGLGNLTKVLQGSQTKDFIYNSLGQLKSATNPESGAVNYSYYSNGTLWKVTDARSITTQLEYDEINRIKTKTYLNDSAGTPTVTYYYDAQTLPALPAGSPTYNRGASIGKLTAVTYGGSSSNSGTYIGYDAVGLAIQSIQVTDGKAYGMAYDYNRAGGMKSQTYPSGRTILTDFDTTGRINTVNGQKAGESNRTYVSSLKYAPQGAVKEMKLGDGANPLWEHTVFNSRLQPTEIGLGTSSTDSSKLKLEYDYGTTNNNGNIQRQVTTAPGSTSLTLTQLYKYDQVNRLTGAEEVSGNVSTWQDSSYVWQQSYGYDQYGNRTSASSTISGSSIAFPTFTPAPEIDPATNQFKKINSSNVSTGFDYDPTGNLTQEPYALNRSVLMNYSYDANNHLVQAKQNNVVVGSYTYDGAGKRVKKVDSSTTIFVYNILGQMVAEYSDTTPLGAGETSYLTADNLGTPRAITNSSGEIIARHDYLPFGEEIGAGIGGRSTDQKYVVDSVRQKFTGYERDDETGLDFAQARYYGNAQGRFTSTDPLLTSAITDNPQSFNRYSYALNNPLMYVDPTGMSTIGGTTQQDEQERQKKQQNDPPPPPAPLITGGDKGFIFDKDGKIIGNYNIKTVVVDPPSSSEFDASNGMPAISGTTGDDPHPFRMFMEFLTGWGPRDRQFGPDSWNTQNMRTSPDVDAHRNAFCESMSCSQLSSYGPAVNKFGLFGWGLIWDGQDGLIRSNIAATRQFVGSFYITIRETNSDHDTLFTITNDTSRESLFYNLNIGNPSSGPLSTKSQTYWWVERNPCGCKPIGAMSGR